MKLKKHNLFLMLALMLLTSCTAAETTSASSSETISSKDSAKVVTTTVLTTETANTPTEKENTTTDTTTETQTVGKNDSDVYESTYQPDTDFSNLETAFPELSFSAVDWNGESSYIVVNDNIPFFSEGEKEDTNVWENYSELDELKRCGVAFANVCKEIMPTEERGKIGMVKPSGWQTSKYDKEVISDMYLFNRCHLIAYMLAGENANEKNLITGTRYLNMDGMLTFEALVDDYIENNPDNHVLYRVTPMYKDDDLVAQGVLMEGWSQEDNGKGVCYCAWCYNVQPYIVIDYSNGNNHLSDDYVKPAETTTVTTTLTTEPEVVQPISHSFVLNTNTKKIHCPDCRSVSTIKPENYAESDKSVEELIAEGYTPCKICNPQ